MGTRSFDNSRKNDFRLLWFDREHRAPSTRACALARDDNSSLRLEAQPSFDFAQGKVGRATRVSLATA